jgi:hypothetical protein
MDSTKDHSPVDISELDRLNRASWAIVKAECDRLERNLAEKQLTIDQLFRYLQTIDPSAKEGLEKMSNAIKDVFLIREKMDSYFAALAQTSPASTPVRFRRLNRV